MYIVLVTAESVPIALLMNCLIKTISRYFAPKKVGQTVKIRLVFIQRTRL